MGDSNRRLKPRRPPTCFGYSQAGHYKRDCPKTKKGASHKAKTAGENQILKVTMRMQHQRNALRMIRTWLVDSGASDLEQTVVSELQEV